MGKEREDFLTQIPQINADFKCEDFSPRKSPNTRNQDLEKRERFY